MISQKQRGLKAMSIQTVKEYLKPFGFSNRVQEFSVSSATVPLAALALGTEEARIAKTLSFRTDSGCLLIVCAGDAKIDNQKFKAQFKFKAKMLSADEVAALTGHTIGGVCPFALNEGVPVWLDISLRRFQTVFPAAGSSNSALELSCDELERCSRAEGWIDVCKIPEG